MSDEIAEAIKVTVAATVAAMAGGFTRVFLALSGGARPWQLRCFDFGLGATLGLITAGAAVYVDPGLREAGWSLLVLFAVAGMGGAMGTRLIDMVTAYAEKKLDLPPRQPPVA